MLLSVVAVTYKTTATVTAGPASLSHAGMQVCSVLFVLVAAPTAPTNLIAPTFVELAIIWLSGANPGL